MKRNLFFAALAALAITACSGLKDAFSAHSGIVARAGSSELTSTQLANYIGNSRAPVNKDVAKTITYLWVDYRLLAEAAANSDSLNDPSAIEESMWPMIANLKARKWYDQLSKNWGTENPGQAQADYASGTALSAQHILLLTQNLNDADKAQMKKRAEVLRAQVNSGNFAALAAANSQDPASAKNGGSLGIFPKGAMVPAFESALLGLKPGDISGIVTTQYGYHIIRRPTYDEVKAQLLQASKGATLQKAESTYLAGIEKTGDIEVKSGAIGTMHAVGADPERYTDDNTVLATSKAGKFTAARLIGWAKTFPPQARIFDQLKSAPDSILTSFLKNLVKNELVIRQADSAKIGPDTAQIADMRRTFLSAIQSAWTQLGIAPAQLADSAKSKDARLTLAGKRIDDYFTRLINDQAPFVQVPAPVVTVLKKKYSSSINDSGLDRAVEQAQKIRATAQPGAANAPQSAVPLGNPPTASSTGGR
ncbi:MAG: peptidyl-prolyl cis-trans isomerase [Gemmatimonadaceae bacterium]|nr:peptidyl-prolyl cis-trans isomerase [Gemmatimonadaceae bacterium]